METTRIELANGATINYKNTPQGIKVYKVIKIKDVWHIIQETISFDVTRQEERFHEMLLSEMNYIQHCIDNGVKF